MGCFPHINPDGLIGIGASKKSGGRTRFSDGNVIAPTSRQDCSVDGEFAERIGAVMKRGLQPPV